MSTRESPSLSFRIPAEVFHKLAAQARAVNTTPGRLAKRLIIERIEDHDTLEMFGRLHELQAELASLRVDIAVALEALLLNLPNTPFTREQVREFVSRKLRQPEADRDA